MPGQPTGATIRVPNHSPSATRNTDRSGPTIRNPNADRLCAKSLANPGAKGGVGKVARRHPPAYLAAVRHEAARALAQAISRGQVRDEDAAHTLASRLLRASGALDRRRAVDDALASVRGPR